MKVWEGNWVNVLADLLAAEGRELGRAGAHDVVRGGDKLVPGEGEKC